MCPRHVTVRMGIHNNQPSNLNPKVFSADAKCHGVLCFGRSMDCHLEQSGTDSRA